MPPPKRVDEYQVLSKVYSHLMKSVDYKAWAKYIHALVKEYLSENPKVLELASGNCRLAKQLEKNYKNIYVSDLSIQMLNSASDYDSPKICCDMTSLPFKGKFDLIICAFDSINYLTSKNKIRIFFEEVRMLMNSDSIFMFDASMLSNSINNSKTSIIKGKIKGAEYSQKSSFNAKTRIHKNEFVVKFNDGNKFNETHLQKIYDFDYFFTEAENAGLYVSECFESFTFREAKYYNERVQFILRKNESHAII